MYNFSIPAKIVHRLKEHMKPIYAKAYSEKLERKDFSIISNNCWGGVTYEWFGLEKLSPTVGSYFFAEDYIRFLKNIRNYLSMELRIVSAEDSRHSSILLKKGQGSIPVGVLGDVEIVFLH